MILNSKVYKCINLSAPPAEVWKALTDPERIKLWMSDGEIEVISDWKTGGSIFIRGNVNGKHEYKGTILEMQTGLLLRYSSWSEISRLPDRPENYSVVEFRVSPVETGTRLEVSHSNLIAEAAFEHSNFYWGNALEVLKNVIGKSDG
jgi:uncharacterized protein YndB with AHSA1/START domain